MGAAETVAQGVPWWVVLSVGVLTFIGTWLGTRSRSKTAKQSNEQMLIDQLQEESKSLRRDLTDLQADVRTLRLREIAWITHTQALTTLLVQAGGNPPELPIQLQLPILTGSDRKQKES